MIILAGSIRIPTDKLEAARPHIEAMVKGSRGEPGCLAYSYGHDALEPGVVHIFEVFEDEAALAAHRASPHMAEWRSRYGEIGLYGRDMSHYEVSSAKKI